MRQQFRELDTWRGKLTATWICLAPPAAMVAVFVVGGVSSNTFVVDAQALSEPRRDAVFDGLAQQTPVQPGVDGSVGSEQRSSIEVPVTGTLEGQKTPVTGPVGTVEGVPGTVLAAYQKAARDVAAARPGCGLTWPLLAGIGKVESAHASGGRVDAAGRTRGEILGPVLDGGPGMAAIADTDQGRFDGNTQWDRAVGPMQFIPGTWAGFGADGNGDGVKDPHNVFDASRAAGEYLCSGEARLGTPSGLVAAVLRYNHSMDYVSTVVRWMRSYSGSAVVTPDDAGVITPPRDRTGNVQPGGDPDRDSTIRAASDGLRLEGPPPGRPATSSTPPAAPPTSAPSSPTVPSVPTAPTAPPSSTRPTPSLPTTPSPTARPPWTISPKPPTKPTPPTMTPTTPPTTPPTSPPTTPPTTPPATPPTSPPTTTPGTPGTPSPTPTDCAAGTPTATPTPTPAPTCTPAGEQTTPDGSASPDQAPSAPASR